MNDQKTAPATELERLQSLRDQYLHAIDSLRTQIQILKQDVDRNESLSRQERFAGAGQVRSYSRHLVSCDRTKLGMDLISALSKARGLLQEHENFLVQLDKQIKRLQEV